MGSGVNTSLLAGLGAGTGLVAAGLVGVSVLFPPAPRNGAPVVPEAVVQTEVEEVAQAVDPQPVPVAEPAEIDLPEPERVSEPDLAVQDPEPAPEAEPEMVEAPIEPEQALAPEQSFEPEQTLEPEPTAAAPQISSENPIETEGMTRDLPPSAPAQESEMAQARLPSGLLPTVRTEGALALPQVLPPPAPTPEASDPAASDAPDADGPQGMVVGQQDSAALPGMRGSSLPQIRGGDQALPDGGTVPAPGDAAISALERNSLYAGSTRGSKMALVLNDPGLPMAMRRSLAAIDFPFTVALNPLDTSAPEAAEIYNDAGKEVLILATSIPEGATASDLDVSFNTFFANLPMAVGVIDLPGTGFGRNARLLGEVLPLLRQDGHGLLTFSGGLAQSARAASAAGVPHAEVFRVLDSGNESAFTIRRFLDRAVFQASQIGQVVVFGDASNDVTMEAIEMWRSGGQLDQVDLVPVSGILLDPR